VSLAGLIVGEVNVSDGSDRAAAHTLDVEDDADAPVGEVTAAPWPWRGACRWSCRALASAFSWVRTK